LRGKEVRSVAMQTVVPCEHCGRMCGDYDGGWSKVTTIDGRTVELCHPNERNRPDCYHLVTVYGRPVGELIGTWK
jgi:hypothetical protein